MGRLVDNSIGTYTFQVEGPPDPAGGAEGSGINVHFMAIRLQAFDKGYAANAKWFQPEYFFQQAFTAGLKSFNAWYERIVQVE